MIKTKSIFIKVILSLSVLVLIISGCASDENNRPTSANDVSSFIVQVYPASGAVDISPSSTMWIKFSQSMDTASVMNNFYYSGGAGMRNWMDSTDYYGGMGHMTMGMNDRMMDWIDSIRISGAFSWNNAFDSCEFIPDSLMRSNTDYMMLMYENGMNNHGGGMMNHGAGGYHTYQFTTGAGNGM